MEDTKKCPYCGEEIKAVAKKCRFCGQWLDEEPVSKIREQKIESPKPVEPQTKHEEQPVVHTQTVNTTSPKPAVEKKEARFRLTFKQVLLIVIPIVALIVLLVSLIFVHSNYSYSVWWEDEEIVILRFILYFIGGLALYYAIVGAVLYYIKRAKKPNRFLSKYGGVLFVAIFGILLGIALFTYTPPVKDITQEPETSSVEETINTPPTTTNEVKEEPSVYEKMRELSRENAVVGVIGDNIYFLKGSKGHYLDRLYMLSVSSGSEYNYKLDRFYDGSMTIQDYAFNNEKITLIVNETDRNSTGFLVATLVINYTPSTGEWEDLTGGGCVKAEFNGGKRQVTLTYGEIANPDAEYTYEYEYKYTTKVISL